METPMLAIPKGVAPPPNLTREAMRYWCAFGGDRPPDDYEYATEAAVSETRDEREELVELIGEWRETFPGIFALADAILAPRPDGSRWMLVHPDEMIRRSDLEQVGWAEVAYRQSRVVDWNGSSPFFRVRSGVEEEGCAGDEETYERDPACVAAWPECESGKYDPRCCRFPKSCSCMIPARQESK